MHLFCKGCLCFPSQKGGCRGSQPDTLETYWYRTEKDFTQPHLPQVQMSISLTTCISKLPNLRAGSLSGLYWSQCIAVKGAQLGYTNWGSGSQRNVIKGKVFARGKKKAEAWVFNNLFTLISHVLNCFSVNIH